MPNNRLLVVTENDGSRWVMAEDYYRLFVATEKLIEELGQAVLEMNARGYSAANISESEDAIKSAKAIMEY